ncbi:MAG: tRNA dimethylallyltransferase, partial [Kiritimatiellia bacterium]|nr:tRNA dimethylallyltransferase [Kiritimatiellia bacterium]
HYAGVNLAEPDEPFSTGAYLQAVGETIPPADPRPWLVCGGTGLYITRLFRGLDRPAGDPEIRREAESRLAQGGLSSLHAWLNELDPEKRRTLADPLNPRRVIRAIEVALSGSAPDGSSGPDPSPIRVIGLSVPPEQLARRIAVRIRRMLRCGWMDEARTLLARKPPLSQTAAMAIGYRELFETIRGERTIEAAVELMEIRTRQYAKRQMTWFRRQFDVDWVAAGEDRNPAEIAEEVEQRIRDRDPIPLLGLVPKGL